MRVKTYLYFVAAIEILRGFLYRLFFKILGVSFTSKSGLQISAQTSIKIFNKKAVIRFGRKIFIRRNCSIIITDGNLKIGNNFFMNNYSSINCLERIEIGDDCLFGEGVRLYDHNHDYKSTLAVTINKKGQQKGFIEIGNNCWLGSNTVVLMNVKIGNNVIVGANNVVFKDIPDNSIVMAKTELIIRKYRDE